MFEYVDFGTFRLGSTSASDVTQITGITGVPGVRGDVYDRPEGDGVVEPSNQYKTARVIVIEGETWGTTIPLAKAAWDSCQSAFDDSINTAVLLKWKHEGGTVDLQTLVRFAGDAVAVLSADERGPFYKYQATVRAADPLIYDQNSQAASVGVSVTSGGIPFPLPFPIPFASATVGGTVSALNSGNVAAWPTITVTGPIANPVIANVTTGKTLYFDSLTLNAGDILTIETNPAFRSASVAGVNKLGGLRFVDSIWPSMTRNVTETWQLYSLGGGTTGATLLTLSWRNTYIS